jgi:hypothetical protein
MLSATKLRSRLEDLTDINKKATHVRTERHVIRSMIWGQCELNCLIVNLSMSCLVCKQHI